MVQQCTTLSPSSFQVLFVTLLLGALLASAECKRRGGGKPKKARSARVSFDHFRNFHRHLHHNNLYHILAICIIMTLIRQERGLGILLEKAVRHLLTFFMQSEPTYFVSEYIFEINHMQVLTFSHIFHAISTHSI